MKSYVAQMLVGLMLALAITASATSVRDDATQRLKNSADVLKEISANPDQGIPDEVLKNAKCIIVIPSLLKAGLLVGGKYGHGVSVCRANAGKRGANGGWSAPAFITMSGGTWGAQIGAEEVDLVMVVMNDKGLQQLLSNKVRMSLEGSATAGPVGRHAAAGADWKMDTEILTYARAKGAFAGQTLEGSVIEQDDEATKAIYGSDISFHKILSGTLNVPAPATPFVHAVVEVTRAATAQEARQRVPSNQN